ncbi:MAG: tRNA-dihydrouridine synthase family protein [Treponema sp.]|nr:tRNA-dihydrouridine synthase family protein [Treponema sp.]
MKMPFMLAPMAELSHRALRELVEGFGGCDEYFTEMISAPALLAGGPFERWYTDNGPCPQRLVYQLVGADSGQIARAAALLDRLECRGIDLNMGCCAPLIRKTGAGITWMASIDRAGELVKQVRRAVKRRLSVKIRVGLTDDFGYLVNFCRRLEAEGVELIVLHPRTASEKLKRLARWDYVGALRGELRIPVAGNGDVADAEGLASRAAGPCDGVMVGRAAVRQPWIFAQAKDKEQRAESREQRAESKEQRGVAEAVIEETGLRFLGLLGRWQPREFHVSRARRFFGFFCDNLKWGTYLKNQLNRQESLSDMEGVWRDFFREGRAETG